MSMVVALTEMETTSDVLSDVHAERMRQDKRWGEQNHDDGTWGLVLTEEVGEACQAALECRRYPSSRDTSLVSHLRGELVHVAAVAVAWIEAIDRR